MIRERRISGLVTCAVKKITKIKIQYRRKLNPATRALITNLHDKIVMYL